MSRRVKLALGSVGVAVVLGALLLCFPVQLWSGWTHATIEFVATDARTGAPIKDAELSVTNVLWRDDKKTEEFVLRTNENGVVSRLCPFADCGGEYHTCRLFKHWDKWGVRAPDWVLRVTAPGYQSLDEFTLKSVWFQRNATRTGPQQSHVLVPLKLEPLL